MTELDRQQRNNDTLGGDSEHPARLFFAPVENEAAIQDPEQKAIYLYWTTLRGDRAGPEYRDFDVVDVPHSVLPHIFLLQYVPGEEDFFPRVLGSQIEDGNGFSVSGQRLKSVEALAGNDLVDTLLLTRSKGVPCLSESLYCGNDPNGKSICRIALPLFSDGGVSHLFGVSKIRFSDAVNRSRFGPRSFKN